MCRSNDCEQFLDPHSIIVREKNCKSKFFALSFSTYQNFDLFLNRIGWKLGSLFPSKLNNEIRQLRISIENINENDRPIDQIELNRLGINIDFYHLYVQNLSPNNSLSQLIHYDPNQPNWNIIQIQFFCHSLIRLDEDSCPAHIIPPSIFAPRRPSMRREKNSFNITNLKIFPSSSLSIKQMKKESNQSIDLIILIFILLFTIFMSTFVYRYRMRKRTVKRSITRRSSPIPSLSDHLDKRNRFDSSHRPNAEAYQISRIPSPHTDSLYKET